MEDYCNKIRCFLCSRKSFGDKHTNIVKTKCPVSGKTLKDVLDYLARSSKIDLYISKADSVCFYCHGQLLEYDAIMMKLLKTQQSLMKLVENAGMGYDSDAEKECNDHILKMEELNNADFFRDFYVSDSEVIQTIKEAVHGPKKFTQNTNIAKRKRKEAVECQFCVMKFRSRTKLQKHIGQAHRKYSCKLCDFSHRNEDYVLLHTNLHEGRLETQCRFCDKNFTTKISTIRHMEVHMNSKKYQCDKCGLCFSQTTVLYNHKLQHEAEEDPLSCEICNQVFKTKRTYRHHMITHRADRPRFSCEHCSKTFTEKYTLKVHKRIHSDMPNEISQEMTNVAQSLPQSNPQQLESKLSCIICDQIFSGKESLNRHMEKEHDVITKSLTVSNYSQYDIVTNEPRKPCHVCGQMFSTQSNLDFHLENVHALDPK